MNPTQLLFKLDNYNLPTHFSKEPFFVCLRSCCVGRIASYVTETTRSKTDKKASKVGGLFDSSYLNTDNPLSQHIG
jgi:hypothetical protein